MTFDATPSLLKFEDVPSWVPNSLCQYSSQESTCFSLAFHAAVPPPATMEAIRVLTAETGPSVRIDFLHAVAVRMQVWDGDAPNGHALVSMGLQKNALYELTRSPWTSALAKDVAWNGTNRLRHFVCAFRIHVYEIAAEKLRWRVFDAAPPLALSHLDGPPPPWR